MASAVPKTPFDVRRGVGLTTVERIALEHCEQRAKWASQ
jgi:hypothetical protein